MLQTAFRGLVHLVYPQLCEGCNLPLVKGEEVICLLCQEHISVTGFQLLEQQEAAYRFTGRIPFIKATSYAWFVSDGLLQHLLHGLKYKGKKKVGNYLGKQLGHQLQQANWASGIDAIIPIPLHPKRLAKRGFNQSDTIAEGLSEIVGLPTITNNLQRTKYTASQVEKTREERVVNVAGAFSVKNPAELTGKHVLLVDDVLTTGATIEAAALALASVDKISVSIATIGITQQ